MVCLFGEMNFPQSRRLFSLCYIACRVFRSGRGKGKGGTTSRMRWRGLMRLLLQGQSNFSCCMHCAVHVCRSKSHATVSWQSGLPYRRLQITSGDTCLERIFLLRQGRT